MSSRSIISAMLIGGRVAGSLKPEDGGLHLTLYPGYIDAQGKKVSSRLVFKAYVNTLSGKASLLRMTQWGRPAYSAAKGLSVGKEFGGRLDIEAYKGRIFVQGPNNQMVPMTDQAGNAILTDKVGFVIREMVYGAEGAKAIQTEIQSGVRPPQWNNSAHPDWKLWEQRLQERKNLKFNAQQHAQAFGYARVVMPPAGTTLVVETDQPSRREAAAMAAAGGQPMTTYANASAPPVTGGFAGEVVTAANGTQAVPPTYVQPGNTVVPGTSGRMF